MVRPPSRQQLQAMAELDEVKTKAEVAALKAKEEAEKVWATAAEAGFFSHFKEYSMELLLPYMLVTSNTALMEAPSVKEKAMVFYSQAKDEIMSTLTLTPPATPAKSFITYNVLGFWLGVFESLFFGVILGHGFISLIWNGGVSFCVAYTLYWTMTCANALPYAKNVMFFSLVFIALYVGFNVYMGISKLLFIVPAVLYFAKALCDTLLLVNGYHLYKAVAGDQLLPSFTSMV